MKIQEALSVTFYYEASERFDTSKAEAEAVLAALWKDKPRKKLSSPFTKYMMIPVKEGNKTTKVHYQFEYAPNPDGSATQANAVSINFVQAFEDPLTLNTTRELDKKEARKARKYKKRMKNNQKADPVDFVRDSFPKKDPEKYFENNPELESNLYHRLRIVEKGKPFTQVLKQVEPVDHGFTDSEFLLMKVSYDNEVQKTKVWYLGHQSTLTDDPSPLTTSLPAGYDKKTLGDFRLEELQKTEHSKHKDRLGKINGMDQVPESEKLPFSISSTSILSVEVIPRMPKGIRNWTCGFPSPIPRISFFTL